MTLHFTQLINGYPNYFVAKIWRSILNENLVDEQELLFFFNKLSANEQSEINDVNPKLHTIRKDQSDLWAPRMIIEPVKLIIFHKRYNLHLT